MPKKAEALDEKGRGSCCSLDFVKQFLQSDTIPEGYTKNDKRALRRRAKSFVLIGEELYFTGGRSRHNKGLKESATGGSENPEDEPDHTQVLRKVVFSEEEQQELINNAHVGEDGAHHGMERTTERVSNQYYWLGIVYGVRKTIHNCLYCSSRIKNPGCSFTFPAGPESTPTSIPNCDTANGNSESKNNDICKMLEREMADGNGQGTDDIDMTLGEDGFSEFSVTDSQSMKHETEAGPMDVFTVNKEVCSHFWQKIEIQIFGPYQAGKKQIYVAVALDSYSQFPEAVTMEVLSSATLTNFFLNLFCRYGAMEKVLLLQNQVTRNKDLFINLQDLQQAGISPLLLLPHVNPLDERWNHLEKSLARFVSLYPDFWFHCLEVFMVPLRITLPPEAIYSPYYLVHGREPPVPDKLNQVCEVNPSAHTEVQLTEDQEKQTVEMIALAYGIYSDNPSIPATLPEPSVMKASTHSTYNAKESTHMGSAAEAERTQHGEKQLHGLGDSKSISAVKKRRGRPKLRERETEIPEEKKEAVEEEQTKSEVGGISEDLCNTEMDIEDDSDKDATYEPEVKFTVKKGPAVPPTRSSGRQRKATYKALTSDIFAKKSTKLIYKSRHRVSSKELVPPLETTQSVCQDQSVESLETRGKRKNHRAKPAGGFRKPFLPKKKRGRPCKVSSDVVKTSVFTRMKSGSKKLQTRFYDSIIKNMQQLSLDTFYFIIKQFLECDIFPPSVSDDIKQSIRHLCSMFYLKDGKLYSNAGKSAGRHIITGEKTRFSLLRKAHARGEVHHGRVSVLKYLSELNVFWNGMSLDLDAFIHCCPECIAHNPLGNLSVVHIPSKSASLTAEGRKEDEPHVAEDEEEISYEDVIQYLTDHTFPPSTTPHQQQHIQECSQSFRIIQGSLHYQTQRMTEPLEVVISDSTKLSAIQEAHVENGDHLSQQDTQARLRGQYFWSGMTFDVLKHVMACCMKHSLCSPPVLHRNPLIQDRVDKFRTYYTNSIPKLDPRVITASGLDWRRTEGMSSVHRGPQGYTGNAPDETAPGSITDHNVVKTVEKIIEDIGKSLTGDKGPQAIAKDEAKMAVESPFGNIKSRKDAHKCQYCGKFISGNVAYRIHLYKHTGVKPFTCSTCGKSFTTSKSLQVHTRKHTGIKPYLCNQCGREFFRGTSFKYHLKTHSRTQLKPLPCNQCDRQFLTQNRLDKHKQYKHPAEPKVYICEHCGKIFLHSRSLKTHEQSHTMKHTCQVCKKEFNRLDQLESHTKAAHTDQNPSKPEKSAYPKIEIEIAVPSESHEPLQQQQQQQQLLPHILYTTAPQTQLVQTIDLNLSNINELQWREEEHQHHHQQAAPPQHIIITERPSGHITIEHPGNVLEQVANHITVSEQGAAGPGITISSQPADHHHHHITIGGDQGAGGGITINSHPVDHMMGDQGTGGITFTGHPGDQHITIGEQAGSQIRISEAQILPGMEEHHHMAKSHHPLGAKTDLDAAYHHHTHTPPPFSHHQPTLPHTTTTHILTQVQLPLPSSSQALPPPQSALLQNPVSSAAAVTHTQLQSMSSHLQSLHTLQPVAATEAVLLQQEAVPVQYEVECLPGDPSLSQADLNAVHLLAQASLAGHHHHQQQQHRQPEEF